MPLLPTNDIEDRKSCTDIKNIDEDRVIWGFDMDKKQRCIINTENSEYASNVVVIQLTNFIKIKMVFGVLKTMNGVVLNTVQNVT